MVFKTKHIPFLILILVSIFPLLQRAYRLEKIEETDHEDSLLPASAHDVVLVSADFSQVPGDALDRDNLMIVSEIDKSLEEMEGLKMHSSILNASVIRAQHDEILVTPFISQELIRSYDPQEIIELKTQYMSFPELWPYLSSDFNSCVFYLEPGLTYSSHLLIKQIEELQKRIRQEYGIVFEFSGLRAIKVYIERSLTQDMLKILPFLFFLISAIYYFSFRNLNVLILAWILKALATTFAYGCFRLFGGKLSPLIILVPTLSFGLLSDYFIHMFYHLQGKSGIHSWRKVRDYLLIPLSLTAFTSIIGFLSLTFMGGNGHILLASTISVSILVTYLLVLWWVPSETFSCVPATHSIRLFDRSISNQIQRILTMIFIQVYKIRNVVFSICLIILALGIVYLPKLKVQAYPLDQFPNSSTVIKAENLLNKKFSGTVPFMLEIDAKRAGSFIAKTNLRLLEDMHRVLRLNPHIGFQNSILTVIKRVHYYFNNSNPRYLAIPDIDDEGMFTSLVEQYLLFFSASASPEAYESLIDSNYRMVAIQGILKYQGIESIDNFLSSLSQMKKVLPLDWSVKLSGPLNELIQRKQRLERNWFFSFAIGSILIFLTVLMFFKSLKMSLISLIPSFFILLVVTGISPIIKMKIDEYTIIVFAVSIGLTIDYTIHMLNAIRNTKISSVMRTRSSVTLRQIVHYGYSLVRSGGVPVFFSFMTSMVALSSLYFSSFSGAVHFALLLSAAIGSAFFISVFLLPLFFAPGRIISIMNISKRRNECD